MIQIIQNCQMMAERYLPKPKSLPPDELFYSQQILLSLQMKSSQTPLTRGHDAVGELLETRLTPLARIAVPCLKYDYRERPSAAQLLQDPFFCWYQTIYPKYIVNHHSLITLCTNYYCVQSALIHFNNILFRYPNLTSRLPYACIMHGNALSFHRY